MQLFMDQQHLTVDSANGNRLIQDLSLQSLILSQLERQLDAGVSLLNQGYPLIPVESVEDNMQEVKDLAAGMRGLMADLRKVNVDAKNKLTSEVARAHVNAQKAMSLATELSDANKEVEDFLGESGSNFPPSGTLATPPVVGEKREGEHYPRSRTLANGVTVNEEV
jgi:hypothetical protein